MNKIKNKKRQQLDMRFKELDKAKDRLNHIESSVITKENNKQFFDFKKNNEFSTLWDDKKLLAKKNSLTPIIQQGNSNYNYGNQNANDSYNNLNANIYNNNFNDYKQNQNAYSYRSSSQYGAYFQNQMSHPI